MNKNRLKATPLVEIPISISRQSSSRSGWIWEAQPLAQISEAWLSKFLPGTQMLAL